MLLFLRKIPPSRRSLGWVTPVAHQKQVSTKKKAKVRTITPALRASAQSSPLFKSFGGDPFTGWATPGGTRVCS